MGHYCHGENKKSEELGADSARCTLWKCRDGVAYEGEGCVSLPRTCTLQAKNVPRGTTAASCA